MEKQRIMLEKLIMDENCLEMLSRPVYQKGICSIVPELQKCMGFDQKNKWHDKNLWDHTVAVIAGCPKDPITRTAALFHDIGKADCMTEGKDGFHHYKGHGKVSAEIAGRVLERLGYDKEHESDILQLIEEHDIFIEETPEFMGAMLQRLGPVQCHRLMCLRRADIMAQAPLNREERLTKVDRINGFFEQPAERSEKT